MPATQPHEITFSRLPTISPGTILAHMSDPRVSRHLPLQTFAWDRAAVADFVAAKEERWRRDGLGHWAILCGGTYVGWGGFQNEDGEWDYGLVLQAGSFGLGTRITRKALAFARADERIPYVTLLLPPSRTRLRALSRLGADFACEVDHNGARFLKFRLETG